MFPHNYFSKLSAFCLGHTDRINFKPFLVFLERHFPFRHLMSMIMLWLPMLIQTCNGLMRLWVSRTGKTTPKITARHRSIWNKNCEMYRMHSCCSVATNVVHSSARWLVPPLTTVLVKILTCEPPHHQSLNSETRRTHLVTELLVIVAVIIEYSLRSDVLAVFERLVRKLLRL